MKSHIAHRLEFILITRNILAGTSTCLQTTPETWTHDTVERQRELLIFAHLPAALTANDKPVSPDDVGLII